VVLAQKSRDRQHISATHLATILIFSLVSQAATVRSGVIPVICVFAVVIFALSWQINACPGEIWKYPISLAIFNYSLVISFLQPIRIRK
jgi:hypothetical protein